MLPLTPTKLTLRKTTMFDLLDKLMNRSRPTLIAIMTDEELELHAAAHEARERLAEAKRALAAAEHAADRTAHVLWHTTETRLGLPMTADLGYHVSKASGRGYISCEGGDENSYLPLSRDAVHELDRDGFFND